jgi:hypothetical protein
MPRSFPAQLAWIIVAGAGTLWALQASRVERATDPIGEVCILKQGDQTGHRASG